MAVSYDVTVPLGKVRLLSLDSDPNNPIFQDEEHQAFLDLNDQEVRLAAAQALDVIAGNEMLVQKAIKVLLLQTDGSKGAAAFSAQADKLRQQYYEGLGDWTGNFDWAEQVFDAFSERERLLAEFARENSLV